METPAVQRQLRAVSVETVELAGIRTLKILVMVNTRKEFPRGILDQVISDTSPTGASERAPGPGLMKSQATSKSQAASVKLSNQPVQVSSDKHPNHNHKRQATSLK